MEVFRWFIGVGMTLIGLWVVFVNCVSVVLSQTTHKYHSLIPFIGAFLCIAGLFVIPIGMPHPILYIMPLILDYGTLLPILWGIAKVYKMIY